MGWRRCCDSVTINLRYPFFADHFVGTLCRACEVVLVVCSALAVSSSFVREEVRHTQCVTGWWLDTAGDGGRSRERREVACHRQEEGG